MPSTLYKPRLSDLTMAADYPAKAIEAIGRIHLATDAACLLQMLHVTTKTIGATASLYVATVPEADDDLTTITLLACDPLFALDECQSPLNEHPWFRYARSHILPATNRALRIENARDREILELARHSGFNSCLIVPTPARVDLGRFGMLCLGSEDEDAFEAEQAHVVLLLARALASELHDWFSVQLRESLLRAADLHPPDLELLSLERHGLTSKQIASATGLTIESVNSRFQRLNVRLGCHSRKASARRAAEYGLI